MICDAQMFERCTSGQCRRSEGEIAQCERLSALREQVKHLNYGARVVKRTGEVAKTILQSLLP